MSRDETLWRSHGYSRRNGGWFQLRDEAQARDGGEAVLGSRPGHTRVGRFIDLTLRCAERGVRADGVQRVAVDVAVDPISDPFESFRCVEICPVERALFPARPFGCADENRIVVGRHRAAVRGVQPEGVDAPGEASVVGHEEPDRGCSNDEIGAIRDGTDLVYVVMTSNCLIMVLQNGSLAWTPLILSFP